MRPVSLPSVRPKMRAGFAIRRPGVAGCEQALRSVALWFVRGKWYGEFAASLPRV